MQHHRPSRRRFLQQTAVVAATGHVLTSRADAAQPPADRLRLGIIGVAGRGYQNLQGVRHENIVALCDVDQDRAAEVRKGFPKAEFFEDFRRLLERKDIQAVVISTPDHTHAPITVAALRAGKHVYCEKPLTHSVHEARVVRATAAKQKLATQMGTQIHASENYRRVVEIIQAGTIGRVRRVHVWVNTKVRPGFRAAKEMAPPQGLNYDLWLGPAPHRPYHESSTHYHWRWWWDFGGGVLADMACHYMDLPHWALNLRIPTTIAASGKVAYKGDNQMPDLMQVEYEYPARGELPPVHLTWYHGVTGPDLSGKATYADYPSGVLFEGEKGNLLAKYGAYRLLPEDRFKGFAPPKPTIARSIGHHREWLDAIRNGGTTTCHFDYAGLLTETVLLGNVAYRSGSKIQWDGKAGRATNTRAAEPYLRREYRKGWTL